MNKVRKGDKVVVLTGRDRGARGVVSSVKDDRVTVEGVNLLRKHTKPNPRTGTPGGIESIEGPLHVSNVAVVNPLTDKADRIGFKTLADGRKVRVFRSNGEVVDRV
jgi:large subunit ribosomal protein L24